MTSGESRFTGNYDELTGLLSYSGLDLIADQTIARSARDGEQLSLACFRVIARDVKNDQDGEFHRNASLIELSWLLRSDLRASDIVARTSDHEIGALLPNTGREQALTVIEQLSCVSARENEKPQQTATVEIGFSTFNPSSQGCDLRAMVEVARLEMSLLSIRWSSSRPRAR